MRQRPSRPAHRRRRPSSELFGLGLVAIVLVSLGLGSAVLSGAISASPPLRSSLGLSSRSDHRGAPRSPRASESSTTSSTLAATTTAPSTSTTVAPSTTTAPTTTLSPTTTLPPSTTAPSTTLSPTTTLPPSTTAPSTTAPSTTLPPTGAPPTQPAGVWVEVLNGSGVEHQASQAATALHNDGFAVNGTGNAADFQHGVSVIAYPPGAAVAAETLSRYVLGDVTLEQDPTLPAGVVDLVTGASYEGIATS